MTNDGGDDTAHQQQPQKNHHNDLYHWVYVFGGTLLVGICDFAFFYHDSHLIAFIILASWLSLISVYELHVRGVRRLGIIAAILLIFTGALLASWIIGPVLPDETETHGWLIAANDPTPPNGCKPPPGALLFVAGTNGAWTLSQDKSTVLSVGGLSILTVERSGGNLSFSADIFDAAGKLSVRIIKNEYHLISGQYAYKDDRSADRSKLALYDSAGKEMLLVYNANKDTVVIRGNFRAPDGSYVIVDDKKMTFPGQNVMTNSCKSNFSGLNAGFTVDKNGFAL